MSMPTNDHVAPSRAADAAAALARAQREEWGRVVGALARRYRDLDLAEDVAAEAFAAAVERWPADGVPPNPGAWLTTTAHRKAIDRLRREARRDDKHREAALLADDAPAEPVGAVEDDRLRLLFVCCHPTLSLEARVALTLRIVAGLTVGEIARAFLVAETTMAQRITRAKARIAAARIPFRVPETDDLPDRIAAVHTVLYLVFSEGYLASGAGSDPVRRELMTEAIRLARLLRDLVPDDHETAGLLALMLLADARSASRVTDDGALVPLPAQDRGRWHAEQIDEGRMLLQPRLAAAHRGHARLGRYELLAAIHLVHASAAHPDDTDWGEIVVLYGMLEHVDPSPIVTLNKAIAVAADGSPEVGLAVLDQLAGRLDDHHALHATRAGFLDDLGRSAEARVAYDRAIALAENPGEVAELIRRRDALTHS